MVDPVSFPHATIVSPKVPEAGLYHFVTAALGEDVNASACSTAYAARKFETSTDSLAFSN